MHLDPFELYRPTTVEEAVSLWNAHAGDVDYLAGGTDLLPNYKMHLNLRHHVIALDQVGELQGVGLDRIGATARLSEVDRSVAIERSLPGLAAAVREVATPLVRESATVGGNLLLETRCFFFNQSEFWRASLGYCLKASGDFCHVVPQKEKCYATFSGDLAPALAVLDAEVELAGPGGRRRLPVMDVYDRAGDGIHRHTIRPGELLVAVHLPPAARARRGTYRKLRVRPAFDFPELGVAAAGRFEGESVHDLRLAVGGLETSPRRFDELTSGVEGSALTDDRIQELGEKVMRAVRPVHNTFLPPDYRRRMTAVYVRRALTGLRGSRSAA